MLSAGGGRNEPPARTEPATDSGSDTRSVADEAASRTTFSQAFRKINRDLLTIGADLNSEIASASSKSDADITSEFRSFARRIRAQIVALDATVAPKGLQPTVESLKAALAASQQDVADIAEGAKAKDLDKVRAATASLIRDSAAVRASRRELAPEPRSTPSQCQRVIDIGPTGPDPADGVGIRVIGVSCESARAWIRRFFFDRNDLRPVPRLGPLNCVEYQTTAWRCGVRNPSVSFTIG